MRCERCGERDATARVTRVDGDRVTMRALCAPCMTAPPDDVRSPARRADAAAEIAAGFRAVVPRLLAAPPDSVAAARDVQALCELVVSLRNLTPDAPLPDEVRRCAERHPGWLGDLT